MNQNLRISLMAILLLLAGGVMSPLYPEGKEKEGSSGCVSYLVIRGETNINRFSFTYNKSRAESGNKSGLLSFPGRYEILIPVKQFEASNPHMYNDFLAHLQENKFPFISIKFDDLGAYKPEDQSNHSVQKVFITLAGVTRQYTIECERVACGDTYILKGNETLRLTDFHIPPPEKLNGLIKVRDEIRVSFGIMLNFTGENSYAISK